MLEPLGILHGPGARDAIETGVARPLCGGPLAFTMVRDADGMAVPVGQYAGELDGLTGPVPGWAGLPPGPLVMGILNVTPDSFSDGGRHFDHAAAVRAGREMMEQGAAILDVGGESTRPGSAPVPPAEEQARILPVIAALAAAGAVISVDTRNAATMARALDAGARIVNDVSALQHDPDAAALVAARGCPVILMHMRGTPATMQTLARYDDVAAAVVDELAQRIAAAEAAGIARAAIAVDPGFGFAKTPAQSLELLTRLSMLVNLGCRIVAGLSRKGFIRTLVQPGTAAESGPASVAAGLAALSQGAGVLRVHDVAATVQAVRVWQVLSGSATGRPTSRCT